MRILLTGGTGYLGGHLAHAFSIRGDEVHATHRKTSMLGDLSVDAVLHDVALGTDAIVAAARPDLILHAATNYGRPGSSFADVDRANRSWPLELLDAAKRHGVALFVNVDTSLPPTISDYARTKREFVELARARTATAGPRLLNIRLESVFGPGDDSAKFQMQLYDALRRHHEAFPLTPGGQTRDYIYIDDAVEAIVILVEHAMRATDRYIEAGVGRGAEVSIRQFAETMARVLEATSTRLDFGALPYRDGELMRSCADISLLRSLGWRGARSLERGFQGMLEGEKLA